MSEIGFGNMRMIRFIILVFITLVAGMLIASVQTHAGS